jgi:DNA-binding FadR family transcriptional regulator
MGEEIGLLLMPPRRTERLGDRIAADIKRLIATEQIEPGQRLPPERELAAHLRVSRVAVRDALRILEQAGFVEVTGSTKGGALVTRNFHKPMAGSMSDLYRQGQLTLQHFVEMRRATECFLVGEAFARATPEDLETLARRNEELLECLEDNKALRHRNSAFHVALAEIAGNPLGVLIVRSLLELLNELKPDSAQTPEFILDTYRRHQRILAALERRDASGCLEAVASDVEQTKHLAEPR